MAYTSVYGRPESRHFAPLTEQSVQKCPLRTFCVGITLAATHSILALLFSSSRPVLLSLAHTYFPELYTQAPPSRWLRRSWSAIFSTAAQLHGSLKRVFVLAVLS